MSNTRKIRWSDAQVTAANAEALVAELWTDAESAVLPDIARKVILDRLAADLAARGHDPGLIEGIGQRAADLPDEFWLNIGRQVIAGPSAG